jgi:hypothetical protein
MFEQVRAVVRTVLVALVLGIVVAACGSTAATPAASVDGEAMAQAVVTAFNSDPYVTHLEQVVEATSEVGTETVAVDLTMSGDISGDEVAIHIAGSSGGDSFEQDFVVVGEVAYVRLGGGDWTATPLSTIGSTVVDLTEGARLVDDPASLDYVGPETVDGRELHHLTAVGTIPYAPATGGTGAYDSFDIWVEADGTPVSVTATFAATDPSGNEASGTIEYTFSEFGGPIQVVAPEGVPAPSE